jgi:protoporphyrinogen oxidase
MTQRCEPDHIVVIGAGFTGLAAAYELARAGLPVIILEMDNQIGGLAGSFKIGDQQVEKFYHHWFNNDKHVIELVRELGCDDQLVRSPTSTGIYVNNVLLKLSSPLDVLRFTPLSFSARIRLGLSVLNARRINNWKHLESLTAREWLLKQCGSQVYRIIWEPLLRGKLGVFAPEVSAAWFWNKLVSRGGSRNKMGKEELLYYRGGFATFAETIANNIKSAGGVIQTGTEAKALVVEDGCIKGVQTINGVIDTRTVIATPALPIIADLVQPYVSKEYLAGLKRIKYLSNVCLVLEMSESLSDIYWLNVTDPDFPFIGVIEHTNFQPPTDYDGKHIVYLSKYLRDTDRLFSMNKDELFEFSLPHIKRMFPEFDISWVRRYHVHKARYAQPIV